MCLFLSLEDIFVIYVKDPTSARDKNYGKIAWPHTQQLKNDSFN